MIDIDYKLFKWDETRAVLSVFTKDVIVVAKGICTTRSDALMEAVREVEDMTTEFTMVTLWGNRAYVFIGPNGFPIGYVLPMVGDDWFYIVDIGG